MSEINQSANAIGTATESKQTHTEPTGAQSAAFSR
jgi:hypothetical protein